MQKQLRVCFPKTTKHANRAFLETEFNNFREQLIDSTLFKSEDRDLKELISKNRQ